MKKNVNVSEQYRNDNSVRQYNQSQTGQFVGEIICKFKQVSQSIPTLAYAQCIPGSYIIPWYQQMLAEQYRNDNSVRQYNQSQTGKFVGLSDDKSATLDIRQYGSWVVWERERG
jgi:hypothetical protein